MINEDLRNQAKANQTNENEREVTKVEKTTNEVQEMKNQTKGKVVIMDIKKILERAEVKFKEFKKETNLFDQVDKYEKLFGKDYKAEMMYSRITDKRIRGKILTNSINRVKDVDEIKKLLKFLKTNEFKLNLLTGCYFVQECYESKLYKGLSGLKIENFWGSLGDILNDNNRFFDKDFICKGSVYISIHKVVSKLKEFGIYDLIHKSTLDLDDYIEFTLKDLNLQEDELFADDVLYDAVESLREVDIEVYEYQCYLFNYDGLIITTLEEEELKETIWSAKFESM